MSATLKPTTTNPQNPFMPQTTPTPSVNRAGTPESTLTPTHRTTTSAPRPISSPTPSPSEGYPTGLYEQGPIFTYKQVEGPKPYGLYEQGPPIEYVITGYPYPEPTTSYGGKGTATMVSQAILGPSMTYSPTGLSEIVPTHRYISETSTTTTGLSPQSTAFVNTMNALIAGDKATTTASSSWPNYFVTATEQATAKGNPLATFVSRISSVFTPINPLGVTTLATVILGAAQGKPKQQVAEEVMNIQYQTEQYWANLFTPNTSGKIDYLGGIGTATVENPLTVVALSYLGGAAIGAGGRVAGGLLGPSVISGLGKAGVVGQGLLKVGELVLEHPKVVIAVGVATFGVAEAYKVSQQMQTGTPNLSMVSIGASPTSSKVSDVNKTVAAYEQPQEKVATPLPSIISGVAQDVIGMTAFGMGLGYGLQHGPISYERLQAPIVNEKGEVTGSNLVWKGLVYGQGQEARPLIGLTPEGLKIGTPKVSEVTFENVYKPILAGEEGYRPLTPIETSFAKQLPMKAEEQNLITGTLDLRKSTFGVISKYMGEEIPIEKPLVETHELSLQTVENLKNWIREQEQIVVGGTTAQVAQEVNAEKVVAPLEIRTPHDIDMYLPTPEIKTSELVSVLGKTEDISKFKVGEGGVGISDKYGSLFDIHDISDVSVSTDYSKVSLSTSKQYHGWGFELEPHIEIGGTPAIALSEQATRKMASIMTLHYDENLGVYAYPTLSGAGLPRMKDIGDYLVAEKVLLASKGALESSREYWSTVGGWLEKLGQAPKTLEIGGAGLNELANIAPNKGAEELTILYSKGVIPKVTGDLELYSAMGTTTTPYLNIGRLAGGISISGAGAKGYDLSFLDVYPLVSLPKSSGVGVGPSVNIKPSDYLGISKVGIPSIISYPSTSKPTMSSFLFYPSPSKYTSPSYYPSYSPSYFTTSHPIPSLTSILGFIASPSPPSTSSPYYPPFSSPPSSPPSIPIPSLGWEKEKRKRKVPKSSIKSLLWEWRFENPYRDIRALTIGLVGGLTQPKRKGRVKVKEVKGITAILAEEGRQARQLTKRFKSQSKKR